jgi:spore germination protein GerM
VKRLLPALLFLFVLVLACGVPEDDTPQELSADDVPFGLLTTAPSTTTTTPGGLQAQLYFVNADGELVPQYRDIEDLAAETVIETLLATDATGLPAGLSSNIPPDTTLLDSFIEDEVLTVDLSPQFTSIEGDRFNAAAAQIVFTATEGGDVEAVSFRVEGEPITVGDDEGVAHEEPVTRNDYDALLA